MQSEDSNRNKTATTSKLLTLARLTYPDKDECEALQDLCQRIRRASMSAIKSIEAVEDRNVDDDAVLKLSQESLEAADNILASFQCRNDS